jgi:hypothetical protein
VLASRGVVFVFSQAEAIVGVPGCCFVGRWVVQAFKSSNGELLWQSLGGNLESGVYNMVVDRARLFIPGRSIDAATGQWDFIVRAYDIRGHSSEIDPIFAAPRNLQLTGTSGLVSYEVTFGGTLTTAAHGAIPAEEQPGTVLDDPTNSINSALASGIGVTFHTITVPAGSRLFQVSLFDTETDGSDDLDVYVFRVGGGFVSSSAGATSEERVTIENPVPGDYIVVIHGYETDGPDANYTLFDWVLGNVAVGNLTVSGPLPPTGPSGTVAVSWSGLLPGLRYLGSVSYDDGTGEIGQTFISITP